MKKILVFIIILSFLIYPCLNAQIWQLHNKLGSSDQQAGDNLGISVAISDSFLVAGAWWEDNDEIDFLNSAGSAYIYRLMPDGTWKETQKLISPNAEKLGYFGFSVAIDKDKMMIGAYNEDQDSIVNAGRVYVYTNMSGVWSLEDEIESPDANNGDTFGHALDLVGDYALIGAFNHDFNEYGENEMDAAGAAYTFKRNPNGEWILLNKLVAPDRAAGDNFGKYLDLDELGFVIGAMNKNASLSLFETGSIYGNYCNDTLVFWSYDEIKTADLVKFSPSDQDNFEKFGWDVATSNNWIVVGKSLESDMNNGESVLNAGAAYFLKWENGEFVFKQKVNASQPSQNAHFGRSIAIHNGRCVIGAGTESFDENNSNPVFQAGAAYIFELQNDDSWKEVQKITGTHRVAGDLFAEDAISLYGSNVAIGAWAADSVASGEELWDGGAVYVFKRSGISNISEETPLMQFTSISLHNPSVGLLDLRFKAVENSSCQFMLNTLNGHTIHTESFQSTNHIQMDFPRLAPGIYIIQLRKHGYEPAVLKWVKQ